MKLWPADDPIERENRDVWAIRLGWGLLVLGLACRLHVYLLAFPIWRDEAALALNFVSRDFRGLLFELDNFQVAPLLFLWVEKAVYELLGGSVFLLRLIPFLAGVSALVLFWHLARRCLPPLPAALALGFLAVAQTPIQLASMVKPYSLDLLMAAVLFTLAMRYLQTPQRLGSLAALALTIPFMVALSYPSVFVAGAVSLIVMPVAWKRGRADRCWFLAYNLLCLAAFALHLRFVGSTGHNPSLPLVRDYMAGYWQGGFLPRRPFAAMSWLIRCHVGHLFSYPLAFNGGGLVGLILVVIGCRSLYRQRRFNLLAICLLPLALNLVAGVLHRYPYAGDQRIEQHLVPGICLLLGAGLADSVGRLTAMRGFVYAGLAAAFVSIALAQAAHDALYPYHDAEAAWARDIAQHLRLKLRESDRIVVPHNDWFALTCLRWHLLSFPDRVIYTKDVENISIAHKDCRVWLLDQTLEASADFQEPSVRDPFEFLSRQARSQWHAIDRMRFFTRQPVSQNDRNPYYFCCDLHVLERWP
jgi:hypothetical protein